MYGNHCTYKIVVTIVYGKPKKLLTESRTMSLSLRCFVALPKIVQADYQPRSPQDKTTHITVNDINFVYFLDYMVET